jgi:hypothetical protein
VNAEERELFIDTVRETTWALLKEMRPGIEALILKDIPLVIHEEDVRNEAVSRVIAKYGRAIERAAFDTVARIRKRGVTP